MALPSHLSHGLCLLHGNLQTTNSLRHKMATAPLRATATWDQVLLESEATHSTEAGGVHCTAPELGAPAVVSPDPSKPCEILTGF